MKDLYIKPEVDFKEFDILDVITGSGQSPTENPGKPTAANDEDPDDWSGFY